MFKIFFGCLAALVVITAHAELVHHHKFDVSVEDSAGTADGALVNGAQVINGQLVLDGIDDYVQFAAHIIPLSGNFYIAFFARQTAPQSGEFVELISQGFSNGPGFYLGHDINGLIRAGDIWQNTGIAFPGDGLFHHYALVANGNDDQTTLYIDGLLVATRNAAITSTGDGTNTRLGSQFDTGGPNLE